MTMTLSQIQPTRPEECLWVRLFSSPKRLCGHICPHAAAPGAGTCFHVPQFRGAPTCMRKILHVSLGARVLP